MTFMQIPRVWRQAVARIAGVVAVLSLVLGGLQYWLEMERLDSTVVRLAQREANGFVDKYLQDDAVDLGGPKLLALVRDVLLDHFPIVEFYDPDQRKRLEAIAPGKEWVEDALRGRKHGFPTDKTPIYHRIDVNDATFIQVLIPLPMGIFEGVYEVSAETRAAIRDSLIRAVFAIVLSVVATGLLLFPLLIGLNREVVRTSRAILTGNIELLEVLGSAIAKRDSDTSVHNYRVTLYAIELARTINLPDSEMRVLIAGSFLHDVGKIGVPDGILLKPGKLDPAEFEIMKTHVELGGHILQKSSWLAVAREVVLNHHEKFGGGGYPRGLSGNEIPLAARIFAIVDVFDALTSQRPYKQPMSLDQSLAIIRKDAGSHFDPVLVDAFGRIAPELYRRLTTMAETDAEALLREKTAGYFGLG
jgi:HD-GYP domain-containing protein (c-di-GMP phosphodiesterase class II)